MNSQSNGRNQRLKGFKVKQALQLVVLLVVCIWLLYQIKNSNNENKDLTAIVHVKLNKEQTSLGLGRKGDTGQPINKTDLKNKNVNIHASREDQKEPNKESHKVDKLRKLVKGQENDEKNPKGTQVKGSDEVPTKIAVLHEETANGTISFNDETGVPQDVKEEQRVGFYGGKRDKGTRADLKSELTSADEEEKSRDDEDSRLVSVHQELEEVNVKSTRQQDE